MRKPSDGNTRFQVVVPEEDSDPEPEKLDPESDEPEESEPELDPELDDPVSDVEDPVSEVPPELPVLVPVLVAGSRYPLQSGIFAQASSSVSPSAQSSIN